MLKTNKQRKRQVIGAKYGMADFVVAIVGGGECGGGIYGSW